MSEERFWEVVFLGDPEFGYDTWDATDPNDRVEVEAVDASTAARKVVAEWRRRDAHEVRESGWYGEGLRVAVREKPPPPPPVRTFVRTNGRMKLDQEADPT